ncbi:uncharacterized protein AAGF69_011497 isoform 1-T4 [Amazona ochrocephala]
MAAGRVRVPAAAAAGEEECLAKTRWVKKRKGKKQAVTPRKAVRKMPWKSREKRSSSLQQVRQETAPLRAESHKKEEGEKLESWEVLQSPDHPRGFLWTYLQTGSSADSAGCMEPTVIQAVLDVPALCLKVPRQVRDLH